MNTETEHLYHKPGHYCEATYPTERGAKIACTKLNKETFSNKFAVLTDAEFNANHNPLVPVKNLLTGTTVMIRKSERGGCCDPSTERYHSM
jgi:hypothetical protein